MDQFLVDVGDAGVAVGDRVVLWGDPSTGAPSVEEWAEWAGTINYEIVARLGARVPRVPVP
jgi:alanine racemase